MKTLEERKKEFEDWWLSQPLSGFERVVSKTSTWNFIEKSISQSKEELVEEIKKQVENFIEDQLCHEVEPRAILNKIPRLINFILEDLSDDMYEQGHKQGFIEGWKARLEAEKKEKVIDEYISEGI